MSKAFISSQIRPGAMRLQGAGLANGVGGGRLAPEEGMQQGLGGAGGLMDEAVTAPPQRSQERDGRSLSKSAAEECVWA